MSGWLLGESIIASALAGLIFLMSEQVLISSHRALNQNDWNLTQLQAKEQSWALRL